MQPVVHKVAGGPLYGASRLPWHDESVIIPGYMDGSTPEVHPATVFDASGWLEDATFWPAHLLAAAGARDAPASFDVDLADVDAMLDELQRMDRWPAFGVSVGDQNNIYLIWRNFDEDIGIDYVLAGEGFESSVVVAALEGHFVGPAWSWRELLDLAEQPDTRRSTAERLLILLPALGDADLPAAALDVVADAITAVGGSRNQIEIARQLLSASSRFWGAPLWLRRDGVSVCLGRHSLRGDPRIAVALGLH